MNHPFHPSSAFIEGSDVTKVYFWAFSFMAVLRAHLVYSFVFHSAGDLIWWYVVVFAFR